MTNGLWRVLGASVAGSGHESRGLGCQDAHGWRVRADGALVLAVADGAGSASAGGAGAGRPLPEGEQFDAWQVFLMEVMEEAKRAVEAEGRRLDVPDREVATTLIVAVATGGLVAVGQVGDGAAVVGDEQGSLMGLSGARLDDQYINHTTFLVSPGAMEQAQVELWHGRAKHLALMSDGLQPLALKMPEGIPHPPFFAPLFAFVSRVEDGADGQGQLAAFLRSPRIGQRVDDDLTLVLAGHL